MWNEPSGGGGSRERFQANLNEGVLTMKKRLIAVMVYGVFSAGWSLAAEPVDNHVKGALADIERYEKQFAGKTSANASTVKRTLKLLALTRQRLDSSENKSHESWIDADKRYKSAGGPAERVPGSEGITGHANIVRRGQHAASPPWLRDFDLRCPQADDFPLPRADQEARPRHPEPDEYDGHRRSKALPRPGVCRQVPAGRPAIPGESGQVRRLPGRSGRRDDRPTPGQVRADDRIRPGLRSQGDGRTR